MFLVGENIEISQNIKKMRKCTVIYGIYNLGMEGREPYINTIYKKNLFLIFFTAYVEN